MKSSIDHLPQRQQDELAVVRSTLLEEFEKALNVGAGGTSEWRRNGRVLKIVLFGSYARTDWVDEPQNGYQSDFDLLVVVSHPKLTDIADYWYTAEDRILHDPRVGRTVNIIVHTMEEVNRSLHQGEAFWADVIEDGIALYEVPGHAFITPRPLLAQERLQTALRHFEDWLPSVERSLTTAGDQAARGEDAGWRKDAAFSLHQAVERAYICFLLVHTFYYPRSHNIKFLRSLAEDVDQALAAAWPRETREERRRFELLKRAYVEARYSEKYDASIEDLQALRASASKLKALVEAACREHIRKLGGAPD